MHSIFEVVRTAEGVGMLLVEPVMDIIGQRSRSQRHSSLIDFQLLVTLRALINIFIVLSLQLLPVSNVGQEYFLEVLKGY
jgi:hypothetical protein